MSLTTAQADAFLQHVLGHIALAPEAIARLRAALRQNRYERGDFVLHAGDCWDRLFYVEAGIIRMFYTDLQGREFNKAFFAETDCTWPVAPRDRDQAIQFSIGAVEATRTIECPFGVLQTVLDAEGLWAAFALPFAEMLVTQKFQREHDLLLLTATERFAKLQQVKPAIVARVPDYHLASFLGITHVSLSRIRRKMFG